MSTPATSLPPPMMANLGELPPYRYRVYGLTIATWIPFPELPPAPAGAPVDAVFRLGDVPETLPEVAGRGARFRAAPGRFLIWLDAVARFLVRDGCEIIVQPEAGATEADLRALLICSPMGALLHQRGVLPLHASVIVSPHGAVVFAGSSGHGKSTLAAHFHRRGYQVLADDIAVVTFNDAGRPEVAPGYPHFKLWPDAVASLGYSQTELPRIRPNVDKHYLGFREAFQAAPLPVAKIYVIERRNDVTGFSVEALAVPDRIRYLLAHTFRARYVAGLGRRQTHFTQLGRLAAAVPIKHVKRQASSSIRLAELADALVADFAP